MKTGQYINRYWYETSYISIDYTDWPETMKAFRAYKKAERLHLMEIKETEGDE